MAMKDCLILYGTPR